MTVSTLGRVTLSIGLLTIPVWAGEGLVSAIRRPSIGIRVEWLPTRVFDTTTVVTSTTTPLAQYTYAASSTSTRLTVAPTLEFRLWRSFTLKTEFRIHRAEYKATTEMISGEADPNAATDDRITSTITETTRANYWEIPMLLQRYGLRRKGFLSHVYLSGGLELRHVGKVRTGNEFSWADGVTDYNEQPASSTQRNQLGFAAGAGLCFTDAFRLKVTPEVRFVRWRGVTFQGPAFHSAANQLEYGIGVSF